MAKNSPRGTSKLKATEITEVEEAEGTTDGLARRSRNQSSITLDSRRGAEDAEKTFILFLSSAISAPLRENLAA
jgi:hypothetical protein